MLLLKLTLTVTFIPLITNRSVKPQVKSQEREDDDDDEEEEEEGEHVEGDDDDADSINGEEDS